MKKRNYTHVQKLLPEIKAMVEARKSQREVAEHFGFKNKYVVKNLLNRQRRKQEKIEAGIMPQPQGRPRKDATPRDIVKEQAYESVYRWRISCCGIFCNLQEGSEATGKICRYVSPPE